jgi:hypothetical protein
MDYKKVFIAAPHFPPSALPPSQRVRLLVRHLAELGWWPTVFTVDHSFRDELSDPWMVQIAGNRFTKIEVACWDQHKTRKIGIGDLGIRMFWSLFFTLLKSIKKEKPAIVVFPVPPWYIMVMGPFIKWITGVPYAIDFIDPWVHNVSKKGIKARLSQLIAKLLEGFVVKRSAVIYAVSEGILNDLRKRYPSIKSKPLIAVPYGVEVSDYSAIMTNERDNNIFTIRYTGAVSDLMLPVVDSLLKAFKIVKETVAIDVVFRGTSYAGAGQAQPKLAELINANCVNSFVKEYPDRVTYKEALEISVNADMQLLIGDTSSYYAASKLMGLIASQKLFFAFVHKDSFPSRFLEDLKYCYKVDFDIENLSEENKIRELAERILLALKTKDQFIPIDLSNHIFNQHTAKEMTKTFTVNFEKAIYESASL